MSSSARPATSRWRAHLALARISNSPTVVTNTLAGAALAGAASLPGMGLPGLGLKVTLAALALTLFYTAGMYLNDLLDLNIDRRERPERPLPAGVISLPEAWLVTLLLFAVGEGILLSLSPRAALAGLLLIALIAVYDAWHKTNPLSPVFMAATRVMVYVTAALVVAGQVAGQVWVWALLLGAYICGLTYVAKLERRTGGARYWPVALLVAPSLYGLLGGGSPLAWVCALLLAAWVAYCLGFIYGPRRDIGRAVGHLIAGCCLLDALAISTAAPTLWLLLPLAAFALTLYWQRSIQGT